MKELLKATITTLMIATGMMLLSLRPQGPIAQIAVYIVYFSYAFTFYALYNYTNLYKDEKTEQSESGRADTPMQGLHPHTPRHNKHRSERPADSRQMRVSKESNVTK